MGAAVVGGADAGVGTQDAHRQLGITHRQERLVKRPAGGETAEGVEKHLLARGGQAGGHAHAVGLGDAGVDHPVGILLVQLGHADAVKQIAVDMDHRRILFHQVRERVHIPLAQGALILLMLSNYGNSCSSPPLQLCPGLRQSLFRVGDGLIPNFRRHLGRVGAGAVGKRTAPPLDGVKHDARGLPLRRIGPVDGVPNGGQVMPVDRLGGQAEGGKLGGQIAVAHNIVHRAVQLIFVGIDQENQMVQAVVGGELGALPHLSLVTFAVADEDEDVIVPPVQPVAQGRAHGGGNPLPQRAGGQVNARGFEPVGVAGQIGMGQIDGGQLLLREIPLERQRGIGRRTGVPLAHDHPVPLLPPGVLRIDAHHLAVEHGQRLHHRHGAAHMAKANGLELLERRHADLLREYAELFQSLLSLHADNTLLHCICAAGRSGPERIYFQYTILLRRFQRKSTGDRAGLCFFPPIGV